MRTPCRLGSASPLNPCIAWCMPAGLQDAASLSCMLSERAAKYMQSHGVLESEGAEKHLTAWGHVSPSRQSIRECCETMAGCCCAAQAHVVSLTARPLLRRFTSVGGVHLAGSLPARGLEPAVRVGAGPPSVCASAASRQPLQAWATGKGLEELEGRDAVSVGWSSGLLVDLSWASELGPLLILKGGGGDGGVDECTGVCGRAWVGGGWGGAEPARWGEADPASGAVCALTVHSKRTCVPL